MGGKHPCETIFLYRGCVKSLNSPLCLTFDTPFFYLSINICSQIGSEFLMADLSLLLSGKTNNVAKDGLSVRIVYRYVLSDLALFPLEYYQFYLCSFYRPKTVQPNAMKFSSIAEEKEN